MIIFFDIGSTLIDGKISPVSYLMKSLHLPKQVKSTLSHFLFATQIEQPGQLAKILNTEFQVAKKLAEQTAIALWDEQIKNAKAIPGAIETVKRFEAAGIRIGYISNIWQPFYSGFEREFSEIAFKHPTFLSFRLGLSKPDPAIYQTALNAINESNAVMVGDTYANDIAPAMRIDMKTIWLLHRPEKEKNALVRVLNREVAKPHLTLAHISELQPEHIYENLKIRNVL